MSAVLDNVYDDPYNGIIDYEYLLLMQDEALFDEHDESITEDILKYLATDS
jgi:hypothetical protein